jgi:autotransporter-associated beta strand protein
MKTKLKRFRIICFGILYFALGITLFDVPVLWAASSNPPVDKSGEILTVNGDGIFRLSEDTIYGGLEGNGTVELNDSNLVRTILTVNIASGEKSFNGTLNGTGQLIKQGDGTQELTGTSRYTGETIVEAGILQGNTNSLQGTITIESNGTVKFNQTEDGAFNGTLTGNSDVIIYNEAMSALETEPRLTFDSNHTYTGDTFIQRGWLLLENGSQLDSKNIFIKAASGLGGVGTIKGNVYVNSDDAHQTCGSLQAYGGDLKIQGNLEFSPGTYLYVIVNGENMGAVDVSKTATINGAIIKAVVDQEYEFDGNMEDFVFLKAKEGTRGEFEKDVESGEGLADYTFYWYKEDDKFWLTLNEDGGGGGDEDNPPPFAVGLSHNQSQTQSALDKVTYNSNPAFYARILEMKSWNQDLDTEKGEYSLDYLNALDQLSGASRANSLRLGMYSPASSMFNRLAMGNTVYGSVPPNNGYGPLDAYGMRGEPTSIRGQAEYCNPHYGLPDACSEPGFWNNSNFWIDVIHIQSNIDSDGNSDGFGSSRTGFLIGRDAVIIPGTKVGLLFGYFSPYMWQHGDRYDADDYHLGLVVQQHLQGAAECLAYLGYAHQQYSATRNIQIPKLENSSLRYTGKTSGDSFFASIEVAQPYKMVSGLVIRPLFGLAYLFTDQNGYTETEGIYALNYKHAAHKQLFLRTGVHFKRETYRSNSVLRLQYVYETLGYGAPESRTQFTSASGLPQMTIRGVNNGRNYLNAGVGLNILLNDLKTRRLGLDYNFNLGEYLTEHAVSLIYAGTF